MKDSLDYAQQHFSSNMSIQRKTYSVTSGPHKHEIIMKEESKLPKKWCIQGTKCKIVQKYFLNLEDNHITDYVTHESYENWIFHSNRINGYYSKTSQCEDYSMISLDFFKKYILNQPLINSKPEDLSYLIDFLKQQQIT